MGLVALQHVRSYFSRDLTRIPCIGASLVAQMVKNLPVIWETRVQSLGQEDPLEMGNGNPLQYSCLENPMDGGGWCAMAFTVCGVAKSQTQLSD